MNRDRGSATLWALTAGALLLVAGTVVALRTAAVVVRHRVESAADLAALAGAGRIGVGGDPCAAARRIASRNGAVLSGCHVALDAGARSGTVVVEVRAVARLPALGALTVRASARAGRLPAAASTP